MKKLFLLCTIFLLTSACSDKYADGSRSAGIEKASGGAILGGIAGGVAGHQLGGGSGNAFATLGGVAVGALAGHAIGGAMDAPVDKEQYSKANARPANENIFQKTLESGRTGEASEHGSVFDKTVKVIPTNTYVGANGLNCRTYNLIDERGFVTSGKACRQANGYWN
jgi:uncharacterized protein YcfJ